MTTEDRTPGTSGGAGRERTGGDPLRMSEAEKRMAEWEARHDVAARGRAPAPDVVQHYLAHERLVHERLAGERSPSAARKTGTAAGTERRVPPAPPSRPAPTAPAETATGGLLRRLFHRRG
jgi:hypothetical protein